MAAAAEVRTLYRAFLREGHRFPNYNIREYILRLTKDRFRHAGPDSQAQLKEAKEQLALVKRQSTVYQLFGRHIKNVLELDAAAKSAGKH